MRKFFKNSDFWNTENRPINPHQIYKWPRRSVWSYRHFYLSKMRFSYLIAALSTPSQAKDDFLNNVMKVRFFINFHFQWLDFRNSPTAVIPFPKNMSKTDRKLVVFIQIMPRDDQKIWNKWHASWLLRVICRTLNLMISGVHSGHMDVTVSTKILIDPCHQWDLANRSINWMLPVEITNDAKPVLKKNMVNNVSLSWSHIPTSKWVVVMSHFDISKPLLISNLASIKFSNVTIVLLLTSSNIMKSTQTSPLSIVTLTGTDLLGAKDEEIQTVQNTIINAVIPDSFTNGTIQTPENVVPERVSVNSTNLVKIYHQATSWPEKFHSRYFSKTSVHEVCPARNMGRSFSFLFTFFRNKYNHVLTLSSPLLEH